MNLLRVYLQKSAVRGVWLSAALLLAGRAAGQAEVPTPIIVQSPDTRIVVDFRLGTSPKEKDFPTFTVSYRGKRLLDDSRLGVAFAGSGSLQTGLRITAVSRAEHDETYNVIAGKTSQARDQYREAIVSLVEIAQPRRRIDVAFRVSDDGVAFRYVFPKQSALTDLVLTDETTRLAFAGNPKTWHLPLKNFTTPYEALYRAGPLKEIAAETLIGLPMLVECSADAWVAVTEANLTEYAGMYLSPAADGQLVSKLSPWPSQTEVKVKAALPHRSPWRVLLIGESPSRLIESNLVNNLNEPCAIADTSWIKPGKTMFPWWNGYVLEGVDFKPGVNTATMKYYIDFCAEQGIPYHSLDGLDIAWYGGPIQPKGPTDITQAAPSIDLPELLRYAKEKNVRLRLWMHWLALKPQIDEAFPIYEKWGIEGVMIDFMDRDDQEMVRFYQEVVTKAAKHHLTVNFHGAYKPTGMRRTWPNLVNHEGVLNLEYNKFRGAQCPPRHNVTVPFLRMLAGPLDYHHGGFRAVTQEQFKARNDAPLVIGTRTHYLAMYVVYENPLPMVADHPAAYRNQPEFKLISQVPTTWDEIRVLNAAVGDSITIARRRGDEWYVGSMTDGTARELSIPLHFLMAGDFAAEIYSDVESAPTKVALHQFLVTASDTLTAKMAAGGGHVIRLSPARSGSSLPRYSTSQ